MSLSLKHTDEILWKVSRAAEAFWPRHTESRVRGHYLVGGIRWVFLKQGVGAWGVF